VHPNDKDSVALLLALRQSGSDASNPGSWNASGESSTHSASYPKGVQVKDDPIPAGTVGRNIGKGWVGMVGGHGAIVSPASSGGQEDDHSQRLYVKVTLCILDLAYIRLDHWLSANASMAVGSLTGPALDTNAFTPLANPNQFDQTTLMNPTLTSPFPNQQWDMNTNMNMNMTPGVNLNMGMDWSQPNTQIQGQFGTVGDILPGVPEVGQENSDEYWNALIDGES